MGNRRGRRATAAPFCMALPDCLLAPEPYACRVRMFEWKTGRQWSMPHLDWLFDECWEFSSAGNLDIWLAYYNDFRGME